MEYKGKKAKTKETVKTKQERNAKNKKGIEKDET